MATIPITQRGSELLKAELHRLKTIERPSVIAAIAEARAQGDLSENAEYDAAKDRQGFIEGRIQEIEGKLSAAQIIDPVSVDAGGRVVGIIPHALAEKEFARHACDELHVVDNMHQRKHMMAERADAFLALPGGIGTFEELFEVWTWRQLGFHNKPIGLLNVANYYDGLQQFLQSTVQQGFLSDWQMDFIHQSTDAHLLLPKLIGAAGLAKSDGLAQI